ncbi:hypothetical protein [Virgisporangium aurantiacum]|uniref:Uncharacterized protein n=1 Tax=Virgisporangium aurantiacum TaxID=175570 RepID=A0A8J3ZF54_9ACTN|nr:hypothetical protein [Virgisporangium aurantiacum]GIJ62957.1 hypothetical protein Vau01_104730 [Virgisporangium aurantiacum]
MISLAAAIPEPLAAATRPTTEEVPRRAVAFHLEDGLVEVDVALTTHGAVRDRGLVLADEAVRPPDPVVRDRQK